MNVQNPQIVLQHLPQPQWFSEMSLPYQNQRWLRGHCKRNGQCPNHLPSVPISKQMTRVIKIHSGATKEPKIKDNIRRTDVNYYLYLK